MAQSSIQCKIHRHHRLNLFWINWIKVSKSQKHFFLKLHCSKTQWSKWPKFVSLHYWHASRGARGVKKSGWPNWSLLWWVGAERSSAKIEETVKNCQNWTKIVKETLFSEGFSNFIQFWQNLSTPTYQRGLQFGFSDFLTPLAPLEACQ